MTFTKDSNLHPKRKISGKRPVSDGIDIFIAQRKNWKTNCIPFLLISFFLFSTPVFSETRNDTVLVQQLVDSAMKIKYNDPEQGRNLANQALLLARKSSHPKFIGMSYSLFGALLDDQGYYAASKRKYDTALICFQQKSFAPGICNVYNNYGLLARKQGLFKEAIPFFSYAIRLADSLQNKRLQARVYQNLGMLYNDMERSSLAIPYLDKAVSFYEDMNIPVQTGRALNNLAIAYEQTNEFPKAETAYRKAMVISEQLGDSLNLAYILDNLGGLFVKMKDPAKGKLYHEKAWKMGSQLNEPNALTLFANNMASVSIELHNYKDGIGWAEKGLKLATEIGNKSEMKRSYGNLSSAYESLGDFRLALRFSEKQRQMEKEIFDEELAQKTSEWEIRYQTTQKEDSIRLLAQDKAIQQLTIEAQDSEIGSNQKTIALLVAGILLIASFAWWRQNQMKLRQQIALTEERNRQQKLGLTAVIQAQEAEQKRIGASLHDSLGQKLAALRLQFQHIFGQDHPEMQQLIHQIADESRSISHQLMPVTLQKMGIVPALKELLEQSLNQSGIQYDFDEHGLENRPPEVVELTVYRAAQEILANTIKHSESEHLSMQLYRTRNQLVFVAEDDGKGFSGVVPDSGMGILNIKTRVFNLNGDFRMEPGQEKGIVTTIRIPLAA